MEFYASCCLISQQLLNIRELLCGLDASGAQNSWDIEVRQIIGISPQVGHVIYMKRKMNGT